MSANITTDVAVIGGGLAGCAAAVEAAKRGVDVTLVDKGVMGRSGSSCTAGGGFSFAGTGSRSESVETAKARHYEDTVTAGEGVNDPRLVQVLVDEAPRRVLELEYLGLRFPRDDDGRVIRIQAPAHGEARTASPEGGGPALMDCLRRQALHRGVHVVERAMAARLFVDGGAIAGMHTLGTGREPNRIISARAVVLAAGSATWLYPFASANYPTTGDAYGLAWPLGVRFANMAFNEFTLIPKVGKRVIATAGISAMMASGSHLLNGEGNRFMEHHPGQEMATRSHLVRAAALEYRAGRGPVWNDSMVIPDEARKQLELGKWGIVKKLRRAGLRWPEERFEWVPATHLCLGGIVVDEWGATDLSGLYAAGEVTGGVHGANRLSGNALSECLVFGARAGRAAANHALRRAAVTVPVSQVEAFEEDLGILESSTGPGIEEWQMAVREVAWEGVGLFRESSALEEAVADLEALAQEQPVCQTRADVIKVLETRNLILAGRLIAEAARLRCETRGQHVRIDYPDSAEEWHRWIVLREEEGHVSTSFQSVPAA